MSSKEDRKRRIKQLMEDELAHRDYALQLMLDESFLRDTFFEVYRQLVISITEQKPEVDSADPTAIVVEQIMQRVGAFLVAGQFMNGFTMGYHLRVFRPQDQVQGEIGSDATRIRVCRVYTHYHLVPKGVCPSDLTDLQLFSCEIATKLGTISGEHGFTPGTQPWDI